MRSAALTVEKVEQYYLSAPPWDKYRLLRALLEKENPDLAIVPKMQVGYQWSSDPTQQHWKF